MWCRNRNQKIVALIVAWTFLATFAFSQIPKVGGHTIWWQDKKTQTQLGLTPAQIRQLNKITDDHLAILRVIDKDLQTKKKEREDLLQKPGKIDMSKLAAIISEINLLREELERGRLTYRIRLSEVLTAEQLAKLVTIQAKEK